MSLTEIFLQLSKTDSEELTVKFTAALIEYARINTHPSLDGGCLLYKELLNYIGALQARLIKIRASLTDGEVLPSFYEETKKYCNRLIELRRIYFTHFPPESILIDSDYQEATSNFTIDSDITPGTSRTNCCWKNPAIVCAADARLPIDELNKILIIHQDRINLDSCIFTTHGLAHALLQGDLTIIKAYIAHGARLDTKESDFLQGNPMHWLVCGMIFWKHSHLNWAPIYEYFSEIFIEASTWPGYQEACRMTDCFGLTPIDYLT